MLRRVCVMQQVAQKSAFERVHFNLCPGDGLLGAIQTLFLQSWSRGRMAPCSPSLGSQAGAAGPATWRPLSEQLDQPSQWTLACLHLLVPDARGEEAVASCPTLEVQRGRWYSLRPGSHLDACFSITLGPSRQGGDWSLGSVPLLLFALPHLLSELICGRPQGGRQRVAAGQGQAVAALL